MPVVHGIFDTATWTVTYVVHAGPGTACAIIDSVLDYDPKSGRTKTASANKVIDYVRGNDLKVAWILETHAHADHLSAAPYLKQHLGGLIAIGARITQVQTVFKGLFNLEPEFRTDGSQFDRLLTDGESFSVGELTAQVLSVPGHTPACVAYQFADTVFVGDTLFMPDYGTARTDFPGGDARTLYRSIHRLLALPDDTRLFVGHDYLPAGRIDHRFETTVAAQRDQNIHVGGGVSEEAFVAMRETRDATLGAPQLILPSLQVNIRAGAMPPPDASSQTWLRLPLNAI
jgi:glyoxylase-like metal-dependent hydrolase (beta-lactamase superfamily II)